MKMGSSNIRVVLWEVGGHLATVQPAVFLCFDQVGEITDDTKDTFQMIPQIKLRGPSFNIKLNKKPPWKKSDGGESNNELAICEVSCRQISIYVSIPASLYLSISK